MPARVAGLPYVCLGYWMKGSARMSYKTRYRLIEVLDRTGWSLLEDEDIPPIRLPAVADELV